MAIGTRTAERGYGARARLNGGALIHTTNCRSRGESEAWLAISSITTPPTSTIRSRRFRLTATILCVTASSASGRLDGKNWPSGQPGGSCAHTFSDSAFSMVGKAIILPG